jgi:NAD(P)-dependent dehydrogenase (short-subunit alcohol dehydrogenase family)
MSRRRPHELLDQRAFITGAASGIGRATALALAAQGVVLFLTDLQAAALDEVVAEITDAGGRVALSRALDVTDFDEVRLFAADIHAEAGAMDIVMNIAGVSAWGTVENLEHRQWRSMVEVNLMGPIHVIEAFIPPMITAGRGGRLVNVSSAAGLIGLPWHAAYSASKFGLRGVSEVLRFDLRRHGIAVTLVCPGGVHTPLTETVEIAGVDKNSAVFRRVQKRFRRRAVSADEAAAAIIDGMLADRYLVFTSHDIRAIHWLQRHCPPAYVVAMRLMNRGAHAVMSRASAA